MPLLLKGSYQSIWPESWYAYEAALIRKDHLASTLRVAGLED